VQESLTDFVLPVIEALFYLKNQCEVVK